MTTPTRAQELDELLEYLRTNRGFDFTGYKRPSLERRIRKRMNDVGADGYAAYLDHLQVHPDEFAHLFDTILINVTSFFRDPEAWSYVAEEIVPKITAGRGQIRVWSPGCASGEEAYTLAMLLCEVLGPKTFNERVKIYATDVDESALTAARQASYEPRDLDAVPEALREKYFHTSGNRRIFRPDLRRALIFGRHDLIQDAPISRLDLLSCRNTLMYLDAETQERILRRFFFALKPDGFLFLGKAEMLFRHSELFQPLHLRNRVFRKIALSTERERAFALGADAISEEGDGERSRRNRIRDLAVELLPLAMLVIDGEGRLVMTNERARTLFSLSHSDLGRPFHELEVSYRPVELRPKIEDAFTGRRVVAFPIDRSAPDGARQGFRVHVTPFFDKGTRLGATVAFEDVTEVARLQEEITESNQQLETALEELQSSNEELETTNEELQSTNEELETTNEELQSTNEELETMNEELQSTNEELDTINRELQERSESLGDSNLYLESVLRSIRSAVIVLDRDLIVRVWSLRATDLWGVRGQEAVGQSLLKVDFGLPLDRLHDPLRASLQGEESLHHVVIEATNRRGQPIRCRVSCVPLLANGGDVRGTILLMEEWKGAEPEAEHPRPGEPPAARPSRKRSRGSRGKGLGGTR